LTNQIHGTDVDTELERGRRHDRPEATFLELFFRLQAKGARQTPVVRHDGLLT
jgi:hypothetical protein